MTCFLNPSYLRVCASSS